MDVVSIATILTAVASILGTVFPAWKKVKVITEQLNTSLTSLNDMMKDDRFEPEEIQKFLDDILKFWGTVVKTKPDGTPSINFLDFIKMIFSGNKKVVHEIDEVPIITDGITIAYGELFKVLKNRFPDANWANFFLSDRDSYRLVKKNHINAFLSQDKTNATEYVVEKHDCDDFSYRLMGQFSVPGWSDLAFGIIWTEAHALNCFVDDELNFWFIEPQNDKIMKELEGWMGKKVRLIMM